MIAEHKRRSPSCPSGFRDDDDLPAVVAAYERGGAAALSIITEEHSWGGDVTDLGAARLASTLPILRKDLLIETYQLVEAKACGADAVLLIVALFDAAQLEQMHASAIDLGLDVLVEVHDERELELALEVDADVIGINNRDLTEARPGGTYKVDVRTTFDLLSHVPVGKTVVSESGISDRAQIEELERVGVDAVLVGERLMRAPDPQLAVQELTHGISQVQA